MKKLALALLLYSCFKTQAQKEDYIWYLGYLPNIPEQKFGGSKIDFHKSPPEISYFNIALNLTPVGMISSPTGEVQFYSGGCSVANKENQIMANSNGINAGQIADVYCPVQGYPTLNGLLALPIQSDLNKYCMLHLRTDNTFLYKDLLLTQINMSLENGLGDVVSKNEIIFQDTFSGFLTAVRHGNGRDWWVVLHKSRSNRSFSYLLDPTGLHDPVVQHIGPQWNYQDWAGQSVFSPDGSKYARANPYNGLYLFDFDRCDGTLSNPLAIDLAVDSASACGVAFSPNSRFLYLSAGTKLFQFDMQAADISASKQLIDEYDGFLAPFPTTFYQQRLAPDGKIYMAATNGVNFLHVINNPDSLGQDCDFVQHGIELPAYTDIGLPNFPFFRLYDLPDSPCDTLGINGGPVSSVEPGRKQWMAFIVSPNPASDHLNIQTTDDEPAKDDFQITLSNTLGQIVHQELLLKGATTHQVSLHFLPGGLYLLTLSKPGGYLQTMRVSVHQN